MKNLCSACEKKDESNCKVLNYALAEGVWDCFAFSGNVGWENDILLDVLSYAIRKRNFKYIPIGQEKTVGELLSTVIKVK